MLLEPETLATLPRPESSRSSILGSALLSLLASLLGAGQSCFGSLSLALLGVRLLEVALSVLVHCLGDLESDASTWLPLLVWEIGHYGLLRRVSAVYPGYIVDLVCDTLPAI